MTKTKKGAETEVPEMMDLESMVPTDSTEVEILGPYSRPTGIFFLLSHPDSEEGRKATNRGAARIRAFNKTLRNPRDLSEEQASRLREIGENNGLELLVACTKGWYTVTYNKEGEITSKENVIVLKGEKLPFSTENARLIYNKIPLIREQVDSFLGDQTAFLPK